VSIKQSFSSVGADVLEEQLACRFVDVSDFLNFCNKVCQKEKSIKLIYFGLLVLNFEGKFQFYF
jgi:hypothetical protein